MNCNFKSVSALWLLVLCFTVCGGCDNREEGVVEQDSKDGVAGATLDLSPSELSMLRIRSKGSCKRTQCEVEDIAVDAISSLGEGNKSIRFVGSSRPLVSRVNGGLKSVGDGSLEDTLAYVVNFADSMGFAIVSADERVPDEVLALVENGCLGDTVDNPGLELFLGMAENFIRTSIESYENRKDSVSEVLEEKLCFVLESKGNKAASVPFVDKIVYSPLETISKQSPMSAVEWGQEFEFFTVEDLQCSGQISPRTGCVATAIAQLMATWQFPERFGGKQLKWGEIVKYSEYASDRNKFFNNKWVGSLSEAPDDIKHSIADMMKYLCESISVDYGCDASSASTSKAVNFIKNRGYLVEGGKDYSYSDCLNSLENKCIVPITGCATKRQNKVLGIVINNTYHDCHSWLVDGFLKKQQEISLCRVYLSGNITTEKLNSTYVTREYLHLNWGWRSISNGYYAKDVFDGTRVPDYDSSGESKGSGYTVGADLKYKLTIYPNIRKP